MSPAARVLACLFAIGCGTTPDVDVPDTGEFAGLPTGVAQWKRVCATGSDDPVTRKFCAGDEPPAIASLADLQALLGFDVHDRASTRIVVTGLSTGLGLRRVTPLNPNAIFITPPAEKLGAEMTLLAFARGEAFLELIAGAPSDPRFFLLRFHPACEATGCNFGDLLTPAIESGWTSYTLYDEATIANTPLDCLQCHQPGGPGTPKILRMQERALPWNHWFASTFTADPNHREADFHAAHGDEPYAGIGPFGQIESPAELEMFLRAAGFVPQPNEYDSNAINNELARGPASATWQATYDKAVTGTAIPPPYYAVDQTDRAKVAAMVDAYERVAAGTLARDELPDIRDILLDAALPAMSIRPAAGLDGRGILVHMCAQCHNGRLDQTQSRARFDVEQLDAMSRDEKDLAIGRLGLADDDLRKMPPVRFHVLSPAERDLAIEELSR